MSTAKPKPDLRTAHPYYMHDAIREQPSRVARVLAQRRDTVARAAEAAAAAQRIVFVGIGTSLNAALVAERFLRYLTGGRAHSLVEQSFEFVHYPPALTPQDFLVVVSHRGWKAFSVEALKKAKAMGAHTLSVTGEHGAEAIHAADFVVETCEQEICYAHTKSYTSALAALAEFAIGIAERRGQLADASARAQLAKVPEWMTQALDSEAAAKEAAKAIARRPRLIFAGAGPNSITAPEAALKVKETSYVAAEGFEIEQFLHGPISEADSRMALVAFLAGGPGDERTKSLLEAVGDLGVIRVAIASQGAGARQGVPAPGLAEHFIEVPATPEWLSPFTHVVAAQLLSYYLALEHGANPDTAREHQPAHDRAKSHYQL